MLIKTRIALLSALLAANLILAACVVTSQPTSAPTASSSSVVTPTPVVEPTRTLATDSVPITLPTPVSKPTPEIRYLAEETAPCTPISGSSVDPCEPDVKIHTNPLVGLGSGGIFEYDQPKTIRGFLDGSSIGSVPHIVLRGTYIPDTARCTSGNPFRVPSYIEPGYHQHSILFQCFADVRANSYILGTGPTRLTVQVSFLHYWEGYYARSAAEEGMTEKELIEQFLEAFVGILEEGYERTGQGIFGREVVLFISPGHNHATEVWEVYRTWDLQRQEDDTVIVVHPHRDDWRGARPDDYQTYRSQLEMGLTAFTQAVTTAHQARVAEYGGRIAPNDIQGRAESVDLPMLVTDANELRQFYVDTGAYNHPDGSPSQPPPPCGLAVPDQANNPALMRDCINLLAAKDTLRGTATLNWSVDTAISEWDGVRVLGSPSRVTRLQLTSEGLTGTIPPDLARLDGLEYLWLNYNQLTGEIPAALGNLASLESLVLNDNQLSGEVPAELGDLASLEALWLNKNRLSGEIPSELADLINLRGLLLSDNRLSGEVPAELGDLASLETLWLGGNQLTGEIPSELGGLTNLQDLSLLRNGLTGEVPAELGNLANLNRLRLARNQLTGCIPPALRNVDDHDLDRLGLQDCATP